MKNPLPPPYEKIDSTIELTELLANVCTTVNNTGSEGRAEGKLGGGGKIYETKKKAQINSVG